MILPVRPHFLFGKLNGDDRMVHVPIPGHLGQMTLLETYTLLAVSKILAPKRIFEIGTFRGDTTVTLARNTRNTSPEILTLDLHIDPEVRLRLELETRIRMLTGHSWDFDFLNYANSVDLVLVDGGHDLETVRRDTENAFHMLATDRLAAVAWHDYGNPAYPDVKKFLDNGAAYLRGKALPVYHVEETMLCVWFNQAI